jgi:hypothetical protein
MFACRDWRCLVRVSNPVPPQYKFSPLVSRWQPSVMPSSQSYDGPQKFHYKWDSIQSKITKWTVLTCLSGPHPMGSQYDIPPRAVFAMCGCVQILSTAQKYRYFIYSVLILKQNKDIFNEMSSFSPSGFDSPRYQIFWDVVGLERGPLILVRIIQELLEWKSSSSGLGNRD